MKSSFEQINSKALRPDEAIHQAIDFLKPPYQDEEQWYAAYCFLLYRELDGYISKNFLMQHITQTQKLPTKISHRGLDIRWQISIATASMYIAIKDGRNFGGLAQTIKLLFEKDGWDIWPSTVCNYLRSQFLYGYNFYLENKNDNANHILIEAVNFWRKCVYNTNFYIYPYRPSEMREEVHEIQAIMFLLRDTGYIKEMKDFSWMTKKIIWDKWPKMMRDAVSTLSKTINPNKYWNV
jgi:hypothetical protein